MRAAWERDSAIDRVSVLTRAVVAGSIVLSVAFTALVAWAHPGRAKSVSRTARNAPVPASSSSPAPARSYGSDDSQASLPASTAAPSTTYTAPPSAYTPQPYYGGGGGGIVSGQT